MPAPPTNSEETKTLAYHERVEKQHGEKIQRIVENNNGLRPVFIEWINKGRTIPPLLAAIDYLRYKNYSFEGVAERYNTTPTSARNHVELLRECRFFDEETL